MTHFRFGAAAVKSRSSRSGARRASLPPGIVVRCLRPLTTPDSPSSRISRSTVHAATRWPWRRRYAVIFRRPYKPSGVPTVARRRVGEPGVGDRPRRRRGCLPVPVRAWGDLHALLSEHAADRLDPEPSCTHLIDESTDQRWRGSSSLAKKIEAAFRISLASLRSRFSRSSCLIRCCSAVVTPGLLLRHRPEPAAPTYAASPHRPRPSGRSPGRRIHRPILIEMIQHHLHRTLALLDRVMLRHDLHPSQRRKRHQTRDGSLRGRPIAKAMPSSMRSPVR